MSYIFQEDNIDKQEAVNEVGNDDTGPFNLLRAAKFEQDKGEVG
ncbi:hypothetical protein SRA_09858 [Streptococcus ratti FA-1 = DSM 20564]|uniref:Uncharacterized protein n=1 Tax=Streptococcus ratti FA-1 = DSM 20564 TaxID=699248 RepID=A0ABN0GRZ5_STRRT|nr:hypothetical protein SRA_09858 [Streptococcus ratti FA-1 = DSM 20564]